MHVAERAIRYADVDENVIELSDVEQTRSRRCERARVDMPRGHDAAEGSGNIRLGDLRCHKVQAARACATAASAFRTSAAAADGAEGFSAAFCAATSAARSAASAEAAS